MALFCCVPDPSSPPSLSSQLQLENGGRFLSSALLDSFFSLCSLVFSIKCRDLRQHCDRGVDFWINGNVIFASLNIAKRGC